jgi:hypothetical protein
MLSPEGLAILKNWLSSSTQLLSFPCGANSGNRPELLVAVTRLDSSVALTNADGVPSVRELAGAHDTIVRTDESLSLRLEFSNGTCIELIEDLKA